MAKMTEEARATVILNGQQANATLKEIEGSARVLNAELKGLKTNTQEFADKSKQLQELNTRLAEIRSQTRAVGDEMKKNSGGMSGLFDSLKASALKMGGAMAAAFSVTAIANYVTGGIQKAIELRDAEKLLLDVLDGNKATQRKLIGLAKERADSTKYTRLEIEETEKFLVVQGRTPEQIHKTILAAQDLAIVTGQTLGKAVEDLDGQWKAGFQRVCKSFPASLRIFRKNNSIMGMPFLSLPKSTRDWPKRR